MPDAVVSGRSIPIGRARRRDLYTSLHFGASIALIFVCTNAVISASGMWRVRWKYFSCRLRYKKKGARSGGRPHEKRSMSPLVGRFSWLVFGEELGHGFGLPANEVRSEVLREERIALGAHHGFLGVLAVFGLWTGKGDEGSGKFHLGVVAMKSGAAQGQRPFH